MSFGKEESVKEFESELSKIIKTRTNMGIEQTIIEHFKEQGEQIGIQKGRQEGMEKGDYQRAIKTAEKCLKEGMNAELVAKITELPLKTVQELTKKLSK